MQSCMALQELQTSRANCIGTGWPTFLSCRKVDKSRLRNKTTEIVDSHWVTLSFYTGLSSTDGKRLYIHAKCQTATSDNYSNLAGLDNKVSREHNKCKESNQRSASVSLVTVQLYFETWAPKPLLRLNAYQDIVWLPQLWSLW